MCLTTPTSFRTNHNIWYQTNGDYRSMISSAWCVTKRGVKLSQYWGDYGSIKFSCNRKTKKAVFDNTVKYMEETFGIKEVSQGPFGGWGDSKYVKSRLAGIKEMSKA